MPTAVVLCVSLWLCAQLKDKREKNRVKDAWSEADALAKQAAEDEELTAAAEAPVVAVLPPAAAHVSSEFDRLSLVLRVRC